VTAAVRAAREAAPELPCELEVDSFDQLDEALGLDLELVLLDNFTADECAEAVRRRDRGAPRTGLEASGGLTIDTAAAYGASGVDFLAVGGLTHSSPALDLGLDLRSR
jgi:nicotinate-nucleotide pyrophosphorylase (carboxylating)